MSPPGRPKGEYRSAQHEGTPVSAAGPLPRRSLSTGQMMAPTGPWGTARSAKEAP